MKAQDESNYNDLFLELKNHQEDKNKTKNREEVLEPLTCVATLDDEISLKESNKKIQYKPSELLEVFKSIPKHYLTKASLQLPNYSFWRIHHPGSNVKRSSMKTKEENTLSTKNVSRKSSLWNKMPEEEYKVDKNISINQDSLNDYENTSPTSIFSKFFSISSGSTHSGQSSIETSPLNSPSSNIFDASNREEYFPQYMGFIEMNNDKRFTNPFLNDNKQQNIPQVSWNNECYPMAYNGVTKSSKQYSTNLNNMPNHIFNNPENVIYPNMFRRNSTNSNLIQNTFNQQPISTNANNFRSNVKNRSYSNPENNVFENFFCYYPNPFLPDNKLKSYPVLDENNPPVYYNRTEKNDINYYQSEQTTLPNSSINKANYENQYFTQPHI
ncbi:hypothetical protein TPHA_0F03580 [Tetrapisispora phaffii CBS 4417]|uniref:Uncharacterized protein n=1 Tax=Tetrapisispora phaffii (strain ATCC 24235 / CBS 4417 / NBRC 1672 / NRRL Y-8282 / UCD 70-5) TaxID=1071381 RepID=G8BUQ2_TETPH|nr:hypothetical protein TPHA_0F03580 [Tetrapisispora phaffii CBS 4417]CCE63838.1 hypothetical protein TPHA_0F03580 [Tetrapisispora phaffii CBS 4417]